MPELPEVETVCRTLRAARLEGPVRRVWRSALNLRIGAYWAKPREHATRLVSCRPGAVHRRGKYILWDFESGQADKGPWQLLVHLGMSGALALHEKGSPVALHTHLQIFFEEGTRVDFVDPRRFGGLCVAPAHEHATQGPLARLGPEPLGECFHGQALHHGLRRKKVAIRDALLDQRVVAGVGNIYAVEALYASKVSPLRPANSLSLTECETLAAEIVRALDQAIAQGGTTLRDYRDPQGAKGRNQTRLLAYGRADQPCARCQQPIQRVALSGRSAFFCAGCQL